MKVIKSIKQFRAFITPYKLKNKTIGFVPTMGALHEGHLSLIKECRKKNDITVVSIFVNPLQFGPKEDFGAYPRTKKKDILLARKENVDIIFYPTADEMYPDRFLTYIKVDEITNVLCGQSRPTHFQGVTTVVGKLINIVTPDVMYLGQKDAQQCAVIKQMVCDLDFPVKVRVMPIVREHDGLAISSRNKYLTQAQRLEAPALYQALCLAKKMVNNGETNAQKIKNAVREIISEKTSGKTEYVECVNTVSLKPLKILSGRVLIALAARIGQTRLIDNIIVEIKYSDTINKNKARLKNNN